MIGPFGTKYIWLAAATAILTIAQMTLMKMGYDLEAFFYLWLSQIFAPAFIAALIISVLIVAKKHTPARLVFKVYLITWLAQIVVGFVIILTGAYSAYI